MKYYCHKDSFTNANETGIVDELRVRNGTAAAIPFNQIVPTINGLVIPAQCGAPNKELKVNAPSKTIERGVYTGGSVYVDPQAKTAVLTTAGSTVSDENGRPLSSVTIPAANVYSTAAGLLSFAADTTSIGISGLSFSPVGMIVVCTRPHFEISAPRNVVALYCLKNGTIDGLLLRVSGYAGRITGGSVSFGNNSVSVSNITGTRNGSAITGCRFHEYEYAFFVWG